MLIQDVTIQGVSALLMHRFHEESEGDLGKTTRKTNISHGTPREQAEKTAYKLPDGTLYLPGSAVSRCLREAASAFKQRGSRKSLKYVIPAAVFIEDETLPLINGDGKSPARAFEVDSRPVTIPSTKGRIIRHRARLDVWSCRFSMQIDETTLDAGVVHEVLTFAGSRQGLLDFRPASGGPFGRFIVTEWKTKK